MLPSVPIPPQSSFYLRCGTSRPLSLAYQLLAPSLTELSVLAPLDGCQRSDNCDCPLCHSAGPPMAQTTDSIPRTLHGTRLNAGMGRVDPDVWFVTEIPGALGLSWATLPPKCLWKFHDGQRASGFRET